MRRLYSDIEAANGGAGRNALHAEEQVRGCAIPGYLS